MPNWCNNTLLIVGPKDQIEKFYETNIINEEFDFNNTIPCPEELLEGEGWYDWCIENWGTKWDAVDTFIQRKNENILYIHFDTAWDPPINWLEKIQDIYPELNFCLFYVEFGMDFMGLASSFKTPVTKQVFSDEDKYGEEEYETGEIKLQILNLCTDIENFCQQIENEDYDDYQDRFENTKEKYLNTAENIFLERLAENIFLERMEIKKEA